MCNSCNNQNNTTSLVKTKEDIKKEIKDNELYILNCTTYLNQSNCVHGINSIQSSIFTDRIRECQNKIEELKIALNREDTTQLNFVEELEIEEEEEIEACSNCNCECDNEDYEDSDNNVICEECYHEIFGMCEKCEDCIEYDDLKKSYFNNSYYCEDCYNSLHSECENCGEDIHNEDYDNHYTFNDSIYCEGCYSDNVGYCEGCDCDYCRDELDYSENDDCYYCEDCYNENSDSDSNANTIDLSNNTFEFVKSKRCYGIELEIEDNSIDNHAIRENTCFGITGDGSLNCGYEYVSPILQGDIGHIEIKKLCDIVQGKELSKRCGFHAHFDARDLNFEDIKKVMLLYRIIEPIIYRMLNKTRYKNNYSKGSDKKLIDIQNLTCEEDLIKLWYSGDSRSRDRYHHTRYYGLNLHSYFYQKTIEIRYHSGTTNFDKVINWVNLHNSLIDYAISHSISDILNFKNYIDCQSLNDIELLSLEKCVIILKGLKVSEKIVAYYKTRFKSFYNSWCS